MKVLIVVDMQNDFVTGSLGSVQAQAILPRVAERIRQAVADGWQIAVTQDTHHADYPDTQEGRRLPVEHCREGTQGWQLCDAVEAAVQGNRVARFCKETFGSLELGAWLREQAPDEIELIGVCTDICVISNAMLCKAFVPQARVCVRGDACAGVTDEAHRVALEAMKSCQIDIL